jgi:hypothetical protein
MFENLTGASSDQTNDDEPKRDAMPTMGFLDHL